MHPERKHGNSPERRDFKGKPQSGEVVRFPIEKTSQSQVISPDGWINMNARSEDLNSALHKHYKKERSLSKTFLVSPAMVGPLTAFYFIALRLCGFGKTPLHPNFRTPKPLFVAPEPEPEPGVLETSWNKITEGLVWLWDQAFAAPEPNILNASWYDVKYGIKEVFVGIKEGLVWILDQAFVTTPAVIGAFALAYATFKITKEWGIPFVTKGGLHPSVILKYREQGWNEKAFAEQVQRSDEEACRRDLEIIGSIFRKFSPLNFFKKLPFLK